MRRTSRVERKSNEKVLKDLEEETDIMRHILKRKTKLIGHLFRLNTFIKNILKRKRS